MPCFYWTEAFQYQPLVESTVHAFRLQPAYTKLVSTVSLMRRTSTSLLNSVHMYCTLGFRGTRVSYQFKIRHYVCRNVPLVHFCTSMLLIPEEQE